MLWVGSAYFAPCTQYFYLHFVKLKRESPEVLNAFSLFRNVFVDIDPFLIEPSRTEFSCKKEFPRIIGS